MIKVHTITYSVQDMPVGYVALFYGYPKTHKTTETSKWSDKGSEGVLLIDTELGSDYVQGCNRVICTSINPPTRRAMKNGEPVNNHAGLPTYEIVPVLERGYTFNTGANKGKPMEAYSLAEILTEIYKNVNDEKAFPYQTIVIDTIDEINDWIEQETCEKLGIKAMGTGEYGSDWATAKNRIKTILADLIRVLKKANKNLILISHAKSSTVTKNVKQLGADLPKGVSKAIMGMCELIGYISIGEHKEATISFAPYDEVQMGSRIEALSNATIPFNYEAFKKHIENYKRGK